MNASAKDYLELFTLSKHAKILEGISSLLHWDQETYMPPGSVGIRAEQMEVMAELIHKERTGSKYAAALKKLINIDTGDIKAEGLNDAQIASLQEWRRDFIKAVALPTKFVKDFAKLTSQSTEAWRSAKHENSFQRFAPFLDRIIDKCRQKAELLGYKEHPYDALLDDYEPNITTKEVDKLFSNLGKSITSLLNKIVDSKQVDDSFLFGKFNHEKQLEFSKLLLQAMGYDMMKGRLDISSHPFSSACHPTDSRITTKIQSNSLMTNLGAVMHEAGHALYEMGLPQEHYGAPLGESISLGIHESQSRWWETRIGQSKPFWQYFLPELKKVFKGQLGDVPLNDFYRGINKVAPSLIRIEADEVTYSLHIILRFEIEKALIDGSLNVRDIPKVWNAKMEKYLGIVPKNDGEGCLQDIHWAFGGFGYFPTYTIGNLYAAQMFETFEKDNPKWKELLVQGNLGFIKTWLNDAVHQHGKRYSSKALLKKITGKKFSETPYLSYLNDKYSDIYRF